MTRRPPITKRPEPLFPYAPLFRSDARDRQLDPHEGIAVGPQPRDVRELLAEPEEDRAEERHRQVGEPADHRGAVGVEHEQRQHDRVEVLAAGEEHAAEPRSEEHTSELQSLMRISYAVLCLKKK